MMEMVHDVEASKLGVVFEHERSRYVWVDVRTDEEYQSGYIPDTLHIPYDQIAYRFTELMGYRQQRILLLCRSGGRSVIAAHILSQQGFRKLYNLKGGMLEWTGPIQQK
jgi:phage shock protein E